jgi:uroporphyrinogen decarboxylase
MTPKDRFLTAMRNDVPDRVPVTPDISNYVPCKRTGLPFWEIYFDNAVPLWKAYLDAADYYGIDAWVASCTGVPLRYEASPVEIVSETSYDKRRDAMVRRTVHHTPAGDLETEDVCYRYDPPTPTVKPIKDLLSDWEAFKWLRRPPVGINTESVEEIRRECHDRDQAFGLCMGYPGFQVWMGSVQGGVEALSYALVDTPGLLDEWFEIDMAIGSATMDLILSVEPDYVLLGGSGTITLASPDLAERYALPAIKAWSKRAADAGVPTMLHSCGRQRVLVDMLVEHTDVICVNPLEIPPMGDVDLAEVKQARGHQIALMGNLHTTDVMLRGSPEQVQTASITAMRAAASGGGFILSSGDQVARDTPEENIFAMIAAAETFGVYDQEAGELIALGS